MKKRFLERPGPRGIRANIMIAFSLTSAFILVLLGIAAYLRFYAISRKAEGYIPDSLIASEMNNIRCFLAILTLLFVLALLFANRLLSLRICEPIRRLDDSVLQYEAGKKPGIHIGGPAEIRHLGESIQKSYEQIDILMENIVKEQTERRKSEMDALQSQINPHFLYNTLDSAIWTVEEGRNEEAAFMLSELAKFFRIGLSGGRTVISIGEELRHALSYMNIQMARYRNRFAVRFDTDPRLDSFCTVKLVLQPLLENAVNYGIRGGEEGGEIRVSARRDGGIIELAVSDDGMGMPDGEPLAGGCRESRRGSGVGLANVEKRIKIVFGEEYGLEVESAWEEGTRVRIRIPAVPYTEENREMLERGRI